jgi:DNA-directed RNA polymerase specialized sigma24 family protein
MKNYKDSDYALNKYSGGIVFRFADGIVEITLADYLAENPDKTEADYHALKELSDSIYLEQVQVENAQTYKNSPYDELNGTALCHAPSPEDYFIGKIDAREAAERRRERLIQASYALGILTEVQRHRYLMYHVDGMTMREIAAIEGAHFTTVHESLQAADKKIKKVLAAG